jgi:hypothetical protein
MTAPTTTRPKDETSTTVAPMTRDEKAARWAELALHWGEVTKYNSAKQDFEQIWRDRWRKPLLPNADYTGIDVYDSPSGAGKLIEDGTGLQKHACRTGALVVAHNEEILDLVISTLPARLDEMTKQEKAKLDSILEPAKQSIGAFGAANRGTTIHGLLEKILKGQELRKVPARYVAMLDAFREVMAPYTAVDIERFVANREVRFAGTLDVRVQQRGDTKAKVLDHKSGASVLEYPKGMALQLAIYAHSQPVDPYTGEITEWMVPTDLDEALLMYVPADGTTAQLYPVDIRTAWDMAADAARKARDWQKYPADALLGAPIDISADRNWKAEIEAAASKAEMRDVWKDALAAGALTAELRTLAEGRAADLPDVVKQSSLAS